MPTPVLKSGTSYFEFSCVSCRESHREYLIEQVLNDETIRIQKYGELPRGKLPRDRVLQKFLKDDLDNYEKAVVCLSHEYGIAAFAYFRRIVENNINRLLDLVQEDAQSSGGEKPPLAAGFLRRRARRVIAQRAGSSAAASSSTGIGARCGELRTRAASVRASSAMAAKISAASSRSAFDISSVGSRVIGSGTSIGL